MTTAIIEQSFQDFPVFFQPDAYLNATSVAKRFNKQPRDYLKTEPTKNYMNSIKTILLIPIDQLVIVKKGSSSNGGGTWIHPKLAIDFARWLNPDFAVWCDMQIEKILHPVRIEPLLVNTEQKRHIQEMVNKIRRDSGTHHHTTYHNIKTEFNVGKYDELKQSQYPAVCRFLGAKPKVIEGELFPLESNTAGGYLSKPYQSMPATTDKDFYAACSRLSSIKSWARKSHNNAVVDDLEVIERSLMSVWTEIDESLLRVDQATSFIKRWRNK